MLPIEYQVHNSDRVHAVGTIGAPSLSTTSFATVYSALTLREAILENLKSRTWRAGHRLPTERELSGQFGLSRGAVRRVLADLKGRGLITQTVGSGTYVSEEVAQALAELSHGESPLATSPAELMSARLVLEPAVIAMVIGNATAADFARMEECCDRGEAAASLEEFELWDGRLHEAIAGAAHNAFISAVFLRMNEVRAQSEWGMLKRRSATPERRLDYQREHRELVAALKDRDGARAVQLCMEHLTHVRRNLLGY
jgi:DNA-binding FadR family transcriptional regulator